jgi:hypothetical protein
MPAFDLAASSMNYFATTDSEYFGVGCNSLEQDWMELSGLLWLNPPFDDIEPWAKKSYESAFGDREILLLTPASVGSSWFGEYVHRKAHVLFLSPRLSFDGKSPYPKDCILSYFGKGDPGYEFWRWK